MHRLKSVRFAVATLCFCLSSSIPAVVSPAMAESTIAADLRNQRRELIAQESEAQTPKPIAGLCRNLQPQFTLVGHLSPVNAIAVSADSKTLVSGDENGVVNVWSLETGQLLYSLAAYPGAVRAIAITPDGKSIISVSSLEGQFDGEKQEKEKDEIFIKAWNLQTGDLIQSLTKQQGMIQTFNSPATQTLIRINEIGEDYSYESKIEFLNQSGRVIPLNSLAVAHDIYGNDSLSIQSTSQKLATTINFYESSFVKLQDLVIQKTPCTVPRLGQVRNIIFSPDGQKLIVAGQRIEVMALNPIPVKLDRAEQQPRIQRLNRLGFDKLKRKQYYSAARHFWQVFELNRQLADEPGQIDALYNIAEVSYASCQVKSDSCVASYQEVYELILPYLREQGDRTHEAVVLQRNKLYEDAIRSKEEDYEQALKKYRSQGNRRAEAATLIKMALLNPNDGEKIQRLLKQAMNLSQGDHKAEADTLVGIAWAEPGKTESVQRSLKQALKLYRSNGDRKGELEALHGLGISLSTMLRKFTDGGTQFIGRKLPEAITYLRSAATLSRKDGDRFLESTILLDLGDVYELGKQYSQALASYQQALDIRQSLGDDTGQAILLYRIAQMQRQLKRYDQAIENFQKAVEVCQVFEDCLYLRREYYLWKSNSNILQELGETYFDLRQYSQALVYLQQLEGSGAGNETLAKYVGLIHEKLGNYNLALKYFDRILKSSGPMCGDGAQSDATIIEAVRQTSSQSNFGCSSNADYESWHLALDTATLHKAEIHRRRGQYAEAAAVYEKTFPRSSRDGSGRAIILNNLGTLYKSQGDYEKALKSYQASLWIRRKSKDPYGEGVNLNNIGEVYRRQGQYPKALETYRQSLKIFRDLTASLTATQAAITPILDISLVLQGEASVLHNLGGAYYDLGQYSKAIEFYNQSLSLSTRLEDKTAQGRSLNNIGLTYEAQQQYTKALETYQQALIARRGAEDLSGEAEILNNIGLVHTKLNQPSLGVEPLQQALAIFQKLEDKASEANTLDSLGTLYIALGQSDQAWESYQNALRLAKEADLPPLEKVIFSNVGNLLVKTNQPELAIVFYKQSVNLTETIRDELRSLPREQQESYTQTVSGTYRNLAALLIQQGRLSEAHAVLELLKLRELSDFTRTAFNVPLGIDSPGISLATIEETALKLILKQFTTLGNFAQKLAKCETKKCPELKQIRDQRNALNLELDRELAKIRVALANHYATQPSSLSPEKLNAEASRIVNVQPGTVLIYPLVLKDKVQFLLALKAGNGAVTFRPFETQVSAEELFKTVQTFRKQLGETTTVGTPKADLATVQATSQRLYSWLIKPLEAELNSSGIKHIVFAPDLITRYIPLAALHDGNQYLIQRFTISTITAASKTDTEAKVPKPTGTQPLLLAMGVSTFKTLNPLTNVPAELDAITKTNQPKDRQGIYPGSEFLNSTFDYEALQASLEKGTYQILHLATHGAFVAGRPENSYLVPGRGQNLTTELIDQLRSSGISKIHLVVLSACETAVGDLASDGMEIPGISYFFLKNEVKSVMASLWNVNDASTALIMQQFYKHIAAGMTKAQALKTVQQDLINGKFTAKDAPKRSDVEPKVIGIDRASRPSTFSHPYYWAPFILIGNSL